MIRIIPAFSIIGILFEHNTPHKVVASNDAVGAIRIAQAASCEIDGFEKILTIGSMNKVRLKNKKRTLLACHRNQRNSGSDLKHYSK